MTEASQPGPTPKTGEPAVDDALSGLDGLAERPLPEHHDQLGRAHEALHEVLYAPVQTAGSESTGGRP